MTVLPNNETLIGGDSEKTTEYHGNSFLEKNCNQIFANSAGLTGEKVNVEITPKKNVFSCELKTKKLMVIASLCSVFVVGVVGAWLTWFTNTIDEFVLSQMVLENNSQAFNIWKKPTSKLIYKQYLFNYTNVENYTNGIDNKFHLEEHGPYTYEETLERFDISFPTDETILFRENRSIKFLPHLSKGLPTDEIVVPNLAVLGGSSFVKKQGYFTRLAFSGLLTAMNEEAFFKIEAHPYITGYDEPFYSLARNFFPYEIPKQMGLMIAKNTPTPYQLTINTGKYDIDKLAMVEKFNGNKKFDYFFGDSCNSITGTDGALHPPKQVQGKKPLFYLFPQACRRLPLVFDKETTVIDGQVLAHRYTSPIDIFDTPDENPGNGCYCDLKNSQCPLKGLFNCTACNYDSPMFISHPHFYKADPSLTKPFTGLNPDKAFDSYFNLHPILGFSLSASMYLQLNIQIQKPDNVSQVAMLEDGMILPVSYAEMILDEKRIPEEVLDIIYLVSFTVPALKLSLKYGFLAIAIISLASLVFIFRRKSCFTLRKAL